MITDSDSNDNSDINISRPPTTDIPSNANIKAMFNFLVELGKF
jgi:hypothetical protein